jgi:BlaI family penicillinase repressor
MKKLPRISESEWLVMRILWSQGASTANEVVKELSDQTKWKPKTIKTLITRLMNKGAIKFKKEGKKYRYYPAVSESECVGAQRRSFVRRVYGGTMKPMLAAFIEERKGSKDGIFRYAVMAVI